MSSSLTKAIPEGALVLARKNDKVHTCVIITNYANILVDSVFAYYYVWSMTIDSCIIVYPNEIMTVLDDTNYYEVKVEYSDLGFGEGYSVNPFRWIPKSSTSPEDFDHCDDDGEEIESAFGLSGVDPEE